MAIGLAGVLVSPNKWVGGLFVVGGGLVDTVSTFWSRRIEDRRRRDGD
ncbi:hypothetical protein [Jidongwangia harbinensis]|nr:hypothetical protein [Jidongwangia harbinensis]MCA2216783.1 hypothetical protein [Jidongwangia harbinensis]